MKPEEAVIAALKERHITLSTAESCTGGLVAQRLTDVPGASTVFPGGVVSYCNAVKAGVLGVSEALLAELGAVSAPVAERMAEGVRSLTGSDWAVSVTGVAGPDRDDRGNEVGTVFAGFAREHETVHLALHLHGSRGEIRAAAADEIFKMLLSALEKEARHG